MQVALVLLLTHPWTCCIGQMPRRASVSLCQEGAGDLASCPMGGWSGAVLAWGWRQAMQVPAELRGAPGLWGEEERQHGSHGPQIR